MQKLAHWATGALILALVLVVGVPGDGAGQAATPKIGVVNIKTVFEKYAKAKDFEEKLEKEAREEKEYMDRMEKELNDLKTEIEVLTPESPLRKEKIEKFISLQALAKFRVEEWNNRTKTRLNSNTAQIYNEIRSEIDAFAQQNGYDLVLKTESGKLDVNSRESANQRVNRRTVLYHSSGMDLSDRIAERLNAAYKAAGGSTPGNPGGR